MRQERRDKNAPTYQRVEFLSLNEIICIRDIKIKYYNVGFINLPLNLRYLTTNNRHKNLITNYVSIN